MLADLGEVDTARRRDLVDLLFGAKLRTLLSLQGRDAGAPALGPIKTARSLTLNIVHDHHLSAMRDNITSVSLRFVKDLVLCTCDGRHSSIRCSATC